MKFIVVVNWSLIDFKDQNFVGQVEQKQRKTADDVQNWDDATESHSYDNN
jgi:hypothetical protein